MPIFIYTSPDEKETVEVVQAMNDTHEYYRDGIKWNRVFTVPQASIDSKIDPFDNHAFIEKIGKSKGSLGDAMDRSKELSEIRADKVGKDPVKEKYLKKWKSERKNHKIHPSEVSRKIEISV